MSAPPTQEFQKCNRSIQQLEVKSLWKANELRAALAREGQLSADLESARSRIAAMEAQVQNHYASLPFCVTSTPLETTIAGR